MHSRLKIQMFVLFMLFWSGHGWAEFFPLQSVLISPKLDCRSTWRQHCEKTVEIVAPQGTQACRLSYGVVSEMGNHHLRVTPIRWYYFDAGSRRRFAGYDLYIASSGSGNPFDRWGGNVELADIQLWVLPAWASHQARVQHDCDMPRFDPEQELRRHRWHPDWVAAR